MPFPTLNPALQRALAQQGYEEPTPVQDAVLAAEPGRDLLVSAQTGSGKTVAFGLIAASELLGQAEQFGEAAAPLALVIAPTRELAQQVQRELDWLYAPAAARVVSCVGGMDPRREQRALSAGCHVVVGTPGRLRPHRTAQPALLSHAGAGDHRPGPPLSAGRHPNRHHLEEPASRRHRVPRGEGRAQ
jgi:ATP-dependent RNA helicase DeaD